MNIESFVEEYLSLPKGYISMKTIKGHLYCYFQYVENGHIKSEYIKADNLERIKKDIARRQHLEEFLKTYFHSLKPLGKISKFAKELTGQLMMGDEVVATFIEDTLISSQIEKCPFIVLRNKNISSFLSLRVFDQTRGHSHLLKKVLNITEQDETLMSLHNYGASLIDNYWFKVKGSKLKYADICFDNDIYSELALKGKVSLLPKEAKNSPELSLRGSYEKCWKLIDRQWWMYKQGNKEEIFSELLGSSLAKALGIPTAIYEYDHGYIRTLNFAQSVNFEPMVSVLGEDERYEYVLDCLNKLNPLLGEQYLLLMWFDALIYNVDRHNENYGLLRDQVTGNILSLAPNFDNNLSLLRAANHLYGDPTRDGLINLFLKFVKNNPQAETFFQQNSLPLLTEKMIQECLDNIPIKEDEKSVISFLINRFDFLNFSLKGNLPK